MKKINHVKKYCLHIVKLCDSHNCHRPWRQNPLTQQYTVLKSLREIRSCLYIPLSDGVFLGLPLQTFTVVVLDGVKLLQVLPHEREHFYVLLSCQQSPVVHVLCGVNIDHLAHPDGVTHQILQSYLISKRNCYGCRPTYSCHTKVVIKQFSKHHKILKLMPRLYL